MTPSKRITSIKLNPEDENAWIAKIKVPADGVPSRDYQKIIFRIKNTTATMMAQKIGL
jgi:hypothetical protein